MPDTRLQNWTAINYSVSKLLKKIETIKEHSLEDLASVSSYETLCSIINSEIVPFVAQRVYFAQRACEH